MKFSTLNPLISATDIIFDCAKCGPPHRVWIAARYRQSPIQGTWSWTAPDDGSGGYDAITISPSIDNHSHGRKKQCGWHISVVNGEVTED